MLTLYFDGDQTGHARGHRSADLETWIDHYGQDADYVAQFLGSEVVLTVTLRMNEIGMTEADLAQKLGVQSRHLSRLMEENPAMSLLTVARLACALDLKVKITLEL